MYVELIKQRSQNICCSLWRFGIASVQNMAWCFPNIGSKALSNVGSQSTTLQESLLVLAKKSIFSTPLSSQSGSKKNIKGQLQVSWPMTWPIFGNNIHIVIANRNAKKGQHVSEMNSKRNNGLNSYCSIPVWKYVISHPVRHRFVIYIMQISLLSSPKIGMPDSENESPNSIMLRCVLKAV